MNATKGAGFVEGTGMVAGLIACALAVLGILSFGTLFVPLAAVVAAIGTVIAINNRNGAGIGVNVLAWVLTILGFVTSPVLVLILYGLLGLSPMESVAIAPAAPPDTARTGVERASSGAAAKPLRSPAPTAKRDSAPSATRRNTALGLVTFKNVAAMRLVCYTYRNKRTEQLLTLHGKEQTTLQMVLGSLIGCSIDVGPESSTTLTWFQPRTTGRYLLQLAQVPCTGCPGNDWRWATTVTDPGGRIDYTNWQ